MNLSMSDDDIRGLYAGAKNQKAEVKILAELNNVPSQTMAEKLREAFTAKGYTYLAPNRTNQIFVIVPDAHLAKISEQFEYSYDQRIDAAHSCVRFCTGWATREENVDALIRCVEKL